jgi:beta-galactosidase
MTVTSPKLWSPESPHLYHLVTEVYADGELSDTDTTRIGIRRFEITRDRFAINGEEMFLRGVNRHQEYPYIGYALSNEAQYRDAKKIKDAGFDYVRLSHYPHSPAFMDACDELGLLVLDAIPGWQYFNPDPAFQDQAIRTCRDMIRRDRNHPCVLAWEVSLNESWMPEEFIDRAIAAAKEEYPGDQCFTAGWQHYGYDIYLQARQHRIQHYETPIQPYIVSEYGDWEYYALNAGFAQNEWKDLLEEKRTSRQLLGSGEKRLLQQAANLQEAHNDNFNTPAFADGYWVMYDYNRGYADDLEASGIMSIFRVPKFSYYFFRSQRGPDESSPAYASGPMLKIASYWDENSSTDVRVFSNCEEVELMLNGDVISRQKPDTGRMCHNLAHPPYTFRLSGYKPGTLVASGFIGGKVVAGDTVTTPGTPSALRLVIDESGRPPKAGVNDAIFVHAIIVDEKGIKVPTNDVEVNFSVTGDAVVLSPDGIAVCEAGIATALIRFGEGAGVINVIAQAQGIRSGQLQFLSRQEH